MGVVEGRDDALDRGRTERLGIERRLVDVLVLQQVHDFVDDGGADGIAVGGRGDGGPVPGRAGAGAVVVEVLQAPAQPEGKGNDGEEEKDDDRGPGGPLAKPRLGLFTRDFHGSPLPHRRRQHWMV